VILKILLTNGKKDGQNGEAKNFGGLEKVNI
jgi:hypothetical protein